MRQIPSQENASATVEGDISEIDDVLQISAIRIVYHLSIPAGKRQQAERAMETHADKCPAYQSVKNCIHVSWNAVITEIS
ncbi:MAG: hypothetical protein GY768_17435 [Planctomycetaceae bacterium]|nr:hypothetical protein [Planctomycetaceae bacterium]